MMEWYGLVYFLASKKFDINLALQGRAKLAEEEMIRGRTKLRSGSAHVNDSHLSVIPYEEYYF